MVALFFCDFFVPLVMTLGVRWRRGFGSLLLLLTVLEHPTGAVGGLNYDFERGTLCSQLEEHRDGGMDGAAGHRWESFRDGTCS